ncbi:hypothetical protein LCGC14_1040160 [marine sediment metagenome]|uniref:Uncharacterized protein n=1 Tax=marine sediment metagenome TaxID=412755 RepID=A0A0F9MWG7_9ZZZZ
MGPSIPAVRQYHWRPAGILTTVQAALTTDKSAATVDALTATGIVKLLPDDGTVALELRVRGLASDGDSNVLNVYAMRDPKGTGDHYTLIGTLTLTTGTQIFSTGNLFADTVTIASELWIDDIVLMSDAANGIARVALNTQGYTHFLFIATTLGSTSVIVDYVRV